jgi:uncharacterized protein YggE
MKTITKLFMLFIISALALSSCGSLSAPQLAIGDQTGEHTILVNGVGKVKIKPDIAYIYIGVHTERPTASEAVSENNNSTNNLIDAIKANGVAAEDIQTSNFSIWANTQYGPDGLPSGTSYVVDNTVYLTVRNLEQLGDLLDAAVQAGANNVNSIQFDVADKSASLTEARKSAVKAAYEQASELASAAGVSLGEITHIEYMDSGQVYGYMGYGMGGGGGGDMASSSVPITTGQMEISATVSVTYVIK